MTSQDLLLELQLLARLNRSPSGILMTLFHLLLAYANQQRPGQIDTVQDNQCHTRNAAFKVRNT